MVRPGRIWLNLFFNGFRELRFSLRLGLALAPFLLFFVFLLSGQFLGSLLPAITVTGHYLYLHGYWVAALRDLSPGGPQVKLRRVKLS
jgi:hypothetical protein